VELFKFQDKFLMLSKSKNVCINHNFVNNVVIISSELIMFKKENNVNYLVIINYLSKISKNINMTTW